MKGLYQQMRDAPIKTLGKCTELDINAFRKALIEGEKEDIEYRKLRLKEIKENGRHLTERAKELGKEVPFELWYILCDDRRHYVGSEFLETYKEWL
jgi:hypothetical protein